MVSHQSDSPLRYGSNLVQLEPMRRPRILEVLFSFRVGGSEIVGLELARHLAQGGADVTCASLEGVSGPLRERCDDYGLQVIDLRIPKRNFFARNGLSLALAKRLKALSLDAIHLQHFLGLNKLGIAARLASIPRIIVTEHADAPLRNSSRGRIFLRANWRLAQKITVIHSGIKDYLVDNIGIPPSRIVVIPNGIDLEAWHRSDRLARRSELGLGTEPTFIFVGRLDPVKNVPGLISAFLTAQERLPNPARLIVVGGGVDAAECQSRLLGSPFSSTVMLVGEQRDTRPFMAAADAFVLNSQSEGTPRALLEAMAMGLPGICSAVGGIPEMLANRGWLTVPGDTSSLVSAILEAANNPARAFQLGAAGRDFVTSKYDVREILRQYQTLLFPRRACNVRSTFPPP